MIADKLFAKLVSGARSRNRERRDSVAVRAVGLLSHLFSSPYRNFSPEIFLM